MATYAELIQASQDWTLTDQIRVACVIAAGSIMTEASTTTNHTNRLLWAKQVFNNPEGAQRMYEELDDETIKAPFRGPTFNRIIKGLFG